MFPFFETILIRNGQPAHLAWHQQRVDSSLFALGFGNHSINLTEIIRLPADIDPGKDYRCRLNYNPSDFDLSFLEYHEREIKTLKIVNCDSIDYHFKYTDRDHLDRLFQMKNQADDILIVKEGMITDTSIANIVFWDGNDWITPSTPLLAGTARKRLISTKQIIEKPVIVSHLKRLKGWNIINALRDFNPGLMHKISGIIP